MPFRKTPCSPVETNKLPDRQCLGLSRKYNSLASPVAEQSCSSGKLGTFLTRVQGIFFHPKMILGETDPRRREWHYCWPAADADIYWEHVVAGGSSRPFSVTVSSSPHKSRMPDVVAITGELPIISWGSMGGGIWTQHTAADLLKYHVLRGEYYANTAPPFFFLTNVFGVPK